MNSLLWKRRRGRGGEGGMKMNALTKSTKEQRMHDEVPPAYRQRHRATGAQLLRAAQTHHGLASSSHSSQSSLAPVGSLACPFSCSAGEAGPLSPSLPSEEEAGERSPFSNGAVVLSGSLAGTGIVCEGCR